MPKEFIHHLKEEFENRADVIIASQQEAYMKHHFKFCGLKSPVRREAQKPFMVSKHLPPKSQLSEIVTLAWEQSQREFQMFGQEFAFKYKKQFVKADIALFEYMITHKSWWDSIDFISVNLVGTYMKMFPQERDLIVDKWMDSDNIWLQRSCLLFQLKYKEELDTSFLERVIHPLLGSKEFFINKAIGWVLREYSKTDSKWVLDFVSKTELSNLSRREAVRLIKN